MTGPTTDPDLIRFLDAATLLAAYARYKNLPDSHEAISLLEEIKRRKLQV